MGDWILSSWCQTFVLFHQHSERGRKFICLNLLWLLPTLIQPFNTALKRCTTFSRGEYEVFVVSSLFQDPLILLCLQTQFYTFLFFSLVCSSISLFSQLPRKLAVSGSAFLEVTINELLVTVGSQCQACPPSPHACTLLGHTLGLLFSRPWIYQA